MFAGAEQRSFGQSIHTERLVPMLYFRIGEIGGAPVVSPYAEDRATRLGRTECQYRDEQCSFVTFQIDRGSARMIRIADRGLEYRCAQLRSLAKVHTR